MLRSLHIKNMALIDELEVDFEEGLNILTGETGAGKSIILGAVTTALGGRTGKEMLREGAEYGLVELLFDISKPLLRAALEKLEIPMHEDSTLIISRRVYPSRTVNRINDETVTISKLKEVAGLLLDIHSQHEHQSLLKKANHLNILDRFGHDMIGVPKKGMEQSYRTYAALREELKRSELDEESRKRQMDFALFEIREIEEAKLQPDEEEQLESDYRRMINGRQIMERLGQAYRFTGYEQSESGGNQLGRACGEINKAAEYDSELSGLQEQLATIDSLLNDFNRELADYMTAMTFDAERFQEVEDRLNQIHNLEAKYGRTISDVLEYLEEKQAEYDRYQDYETYRERLEEDCRNALQEYMQYAGQVSEARRAEACILTEMITNALQELNFPNVDFRMEFHSLEQPTGNGMEEGYFMISANVGEAIKPLWEVASGGELSRIMLAIKSCLAEEDDIDTLIFDEIDVGISGRTAQKVSEKLSAIAKKHQVICISHLPQIAAMADVHFKIEKQVIGEKTVTGIERLQENASIEEIARMLGGVEITDSVLANAAEMKELANRTKLY